MKKTLLTIAVALASFLGINLQTAAQTTKTFTDYLIVTVNEESSEPQAADIKVSVLDNVMTFALKNFCLAAGDDVIGVGNIELTDIELSETEMDGVYSFSVNKSITITAGDLEDVSMWLGPELGEIPIVLKGNICNDKLYVTIDIDMVALLGQTIQVEVGTPIDNTTMENKVYSDYLIVTVNEESSAPQLTNISVTVEEGKMNFSLKNFCLAAGDDVIGVGNISLDDVELRDTEHEGFYEFEVNRNITITAGDLEDVSMWLGPELGEIPINLKGIICDKKLYVTIAIDMMALLGQNIDVLVGQPFDYTIIFPKKIAAHALTFIVDGETIFSEEVEEGAAITAPDVAEREGYTFYWRSEIPETMPGEDVEITGEYVINKYWVTFSVEGEPIYQEQQEYGSVITVPSVPMREGYTFTWDQDIPETVPADHVTINGTYVVNQYPIKVMDVDTGDIIYEGLMDYGAEITLPTMEEREGYTFEWVGQNPDIMPAYEVILKGVYSANYYTCTWMLDGEFYKEMSIPYGEAVPDVPVEGNERYTFGGWNDVPETMPAHDIVIYGGMVDGVASAQLSTLNTQRTYNLAGMRVNLKHARGIIIVDGKKILKK